jgi:HSP20 family protein
MVHPSKNASGIAGLERQMNRMFDDFFEDFNQSPIAKITGKSGTFVPRMDVSENETEYTLTAELAGMDENDIQIEVLDDVLTIQGEKKSTRDENDEQSRLAERTYGKFSRSVALGENVNQDAIEAAFRKGVLTVRLPKAPAGKPEAKKIDIKN